MSQGWCAKGIEKSKRNHIARHGNTRKGVLARAVPSTFAERAIAFEAYKRIMHGFREGNFVNQGGVQWVGREGTGLPSEGYDDVKFDVAVVTPSDEKHHAKRNSKVTSKVTPKLVAAPKVAKWSRKSGFAAR
jgi:hypothetical protein